MNYKMTHVEYNRLPDGISFIRRELELKAVGVGLIHLSSGQGYKFLHQHEEQEEVYFILSGQGIVYIDGEDISVKKGDIIRISPEGKRALKANDHCDLIAVCVGGLPVDKYPRSEKSNTLIDDGIPDFDVLPHWYQDDEEVKLFVQHLKKKRNERNTNLSSGRK